MTETFMHIFSLKNKFSVNFCGINDFHEYQED